MDEEQLPFWKLVLKNWVWAVTSSLLAAILTVLQFFGVPIPSGAAWLLVVIGIVLAIWVAGQHTHSERKKLAEQLKPKLKIIGVADLVPGDDHLRIMVHNASAKKVRFTAKLEKTVPKINYQLPVPLELTHGQEEIEKNGMQPVDVLVDITRGPIPWMNHPLYHHLGNGSFIGLKLMGKPAYPYPIPKSQRTELLISVYPTSEDGAGEKRWFYIVPQSDGSIIFTANGRVGNLSPSAGDPAP